LKNARNLLIDLDGTLTDPREGITRCIAHALWEMGQTPPPDEALLFAIGPPLRDSFATLLDTRDATRIEQAMKHYRDRFATVGLFENEVYPGIPEMLHGLDASGLRLFVATAKPHVYAKQILAHFNLSEPFEAIYGPELDGTRQNKTELLKHLIALERLDPACTMMIGDRIHDIEAAHANGCRSIGIAWGYGSAEELATADYRFDTPSALAGAFLAR
jgi:phosphoglycolate phosphatase